MVAAQVRRARQRADKHGKVPREPVNFALSPVSACTRRIISHDLSLPAQARQVPLLTGRPMTLWTHSWPISTCRNEINPGLGTHSARLTDCDRSLPTDAYRRFYLLECASSKCRICKHSSGSSSDDRGNHKALPVKDKR